MGRRHLSRLAARPQAGYADDIGRFSAAIPAAQDPPEPPRPGGLVCQYPGPYVFRPTMFGRPRPRGSVVGAARRFFLLGVPRRRVAVRDIGRAPALTAIRPGPVVLVGELGMAAGALGQLPGGRGPDLGPGPGQDLPPQGGADRHHAQVQDHAPQGDVLPQLGERVHRATRTASISAAMATKNRPAHRPALISCQWPPSGTPWNRW